MTTISPMRWLVLIKQKDSATDRSLTEAREALENHREMMVRAKASPLRLAPANGHRRRFTDP